MNMRVYVCVLALLVVTAAFGEKRLWLDSTYQFAEFNGSSIEAGFDETLKLEPTIISNYDMNTEPKEQFLIQHDVAVTTYDEPSRLYLLENRKLKPYLGEFRGARIYQFEGDPSPWQYGPALGAKYTLTPNIFLFTEYNRGWWGIDSRDWMTERGDSIHMGIKFEFGGKKSK